MHTVDPDNDPWKKSLLNFMEFVEDLLVIDERIGSGLRTPK